MNRNMEEQKRESSKYLMSAEPVPTPVIVHYNLPTMAEPHGKFYKNQYN